jgi:hypothetical protein
MDFSHIEKNIRINHDYIPIPIKNNKIKLNVIDMYHIDDKKGFIKFSDTDTYILIDEYDKNIVKGYVIKNNTEHVKFYVNYDRGQYLALLAQNPKRINKDNLIIDDNGFYFKNVNYEIYSQEISDKLNDKINIIAKNMSIDNIVDKVKKFIKGLENQYGIEISYGGGRSDEIPHVLNVTNKYDIYHYSKIDVEYISIFNDFIYE